MNAETADVLIVGAGPAGLALANYLAQQNVPTAIIDDNPGPPARESSFLHGPGSEVLRRLGVLRSLPSESFPLSKTTAYVGRQPIRMRYAAPEQEDPVLPLVVPQAGIEKVLRDRLAGRGIEVRWDSGLAGIEQDADGSTAVLASGERLPARWIVGCDGADSMVRKAAGIGFPGRSDRYLLIDAHADWDLDRDSLTGWLHPDGRVGAMPMIDPGGSGDLWRILARDPEPDSEPPRDDEIVSRVRAVLAQRTRYGATPLRAITTKIVFIAHARIADQYRQGHVLLAGDAAHAHVPFGGPAIHTGLGDAENLAWKLALVLNGQADESLLDTYQAERRPIAADILLGLSRSSKVDEMRNPIATFARDQIVAPLLSIPWVQGLTTLTASRLLESYAAGPLGGSSRLGPKPRPGDELPDQECIRAGDGRRTWLYDEVGTQWVLLVPADGASRSADIARRRLGDDRVTILKRTAGPAPGKSARTRGPAGEVWLIRPDAHLAWRGRPGAVGLGHWLEIALGRGRSRTVAA